MNDRITIITGASGALRGDMATSLASRGVAVLGTYRNATSEAETLVRGSRVDSLVPRTMATELGGGVVLNDPAAEAYLASAIARGPVGQPDDVGRECFGAAARTPSGRATDPKPLLAAH